MNTNRKNVRPWGTSIIAAALVWLASAGPLAQAAGLLVADGGFGGVLETKEHDVRVTINNGVAVTEVEQIFVNTENRIVEALYTFPVPRGASVANFSMWINGQEMIGEVVEKERARKIYNSYKQTRRDPGLLEQVNYKRFEMRIFPIPARGEQRVKVTYYQELNIDHDWATYTYPLATIVDGQSIDERTTGRFSFSLEVKSEVPIASMESPSHSDEFVIAQHQNSYYQASLEVDGGDLSRDIVLAYHLQRPQSGIDLITSKSADEDGYFQLTVTAGPELEANSDGMDYLFVLDISGSMAQDGKLRTSRKSIEAFVRSLAPADRFDLLVFNVQPKAMFKELRSADEAGQQAASEFLASQQARGGTMLRPALQTAYRYRDADRQLNVVVLSDGMTEAQEQRELLEQISARPAGTRVFCIGVGNEVNRPLLKQIADEAGGLAAFLSQGDDFERQAQAFRRKLLRPAMSDLKLDFAGGQVYDVEPKRLPDLYHGAPLHIYGRYRKADLLTVSVSAEVLGKSIEQEFVADLPDENNANPEIERTWASHRVERLFAEERREGKAGSQQEAIVTLCEDYSIVSEYASFLVLENDAEYQRWAIDRKNVGRIQRDRAARTKRREQLRALRDEGLAKLGPTTEPTASSRKPAAQRRVPSPTVNSTQPQVAQRPARSPMNFNLGGGGGGGAIDPISGTVLLTLAGMGAWAKRRQTTTPDA